MSERKRCIRCERAIDDWSRICPFCNQDQSQPVPAVSAVPSPAAAYKPPEEFNLRKKALMAGGGLLLLIASFGIGSIINRDDAVEKAPESAVEQSAEEAQRGNQLRRADTPLVPVGEATPIEQPITSAPSAVPVQGMPSEYDRSDATAVSSAEYAQLAQRAKAEKARTSPLVDPRTLSGPAYAQGPRQPIRRAAPRPATAPNIPGAPQSASQVAAAEAPRGARTNPIPQYQPIPSINYRGSAKARLDLIVGADGRVQRIHIRNAVPGGGTSRLIDSVRSWRFKPATVNGRPVTGAYSVEISFRGNG